MKRVSWLKAGHSNTIFTVRDVVRGTDGAVMASYEFDEYGRRLATSETGASSQKTFVGGLSVQDEVADTGLMMMGHRFYAPDHGRFLNRDPIGFAGGLNLFEYAGSSPVQMVDPRGLQEEGFPFSQPSEFFSKLVGESREQLKEFKEWVLTTASVAPGPTGYVAGIALWITSDEEENGGVNPFIIGPLSGLSRLLRLKKAAENIGYTDPMSIRFTQGGCSMRFKDGSSVTDLISALKSGSVTADDIPPLRIFERDGKIYSLDNRRLFAFKEAKIDVRVKAATQREIRDEAWKMNDMLDDGMTIKVRGIGVHTYE